eukprot:7612211-Lingulodinium_polyedra.AAC.1
MTPSQVGQPTHHSPADNATDCCSPFMPTHRDWRPNCNPIRMASCVYVHLCLAQMGMDIDAV